MKLFFVENRAYFSQPEKIKGGTLKIETVPKKDCTMTIGKQSYVSKDGVFTIPIDELSNGINRVNIAGYTCEALVKSEESLLPCGLSIRDLLPIISKIDELSNTISKLEARLTDMIVDPFI